MGRKKNSFSPKATPKTTPRWPKSSHSSYKSTDHANQEQKIWTLTDTPKSTPLMAVCEIPDLPRAEVWNVNKIPEPESTTSPLTTSSLSESGASTPAETSPSTSLTFVSVISLTSESETLDTECPSTSREPTPACDLTETTASNPLPAIPQSVLVPVVSSGVTISESPPSSNPSTPQDSPSLSLHPASSDELTRTLSMETDHTSSSTQSCKTPVAPSGEVVIAMEDDDDGQIIYPSDKSHGETFGTATFAEKETATIKVVIPMEDDDDGQIIYPSDKSHGETFGTATFAEKETATIKVVIPMKDDDDEEIIHTNEKVQAEESITVADTGDDARETELAQTMEHIDNKGKSWIMSGFDSFYDEPCYMGEKPEIQNTSDTAIEIMTSGVYNEETTDAIDNSQGGKFNFFSAKFTSRLEIVGDRLRPSVTSLNRL